MDRIDPTTLKTGDQMVDTLANTLYWFEKGRPQPISKDIHSQLGCHFEEVVEMIDEIEGLTNEASVALATACNALHDLANLLKQNDGVVVIRETRRLKMLDAIVDQLVTVTGVGHCLHMDPVGGLAEANRSNFSKFDAEGKPIYDPVTRKIMKGPNYSEPDLTPYI